MPKKSLSEEDVGTKKRKMNAKGIGVLFVIVTFLMCVAPVGAQPLETVFDTSEGTYPSIMGVHKGYFTPKHNISVYQIYTYPCAGTGGHSEYVAFYDENGNEIANASWDGYPGDCHNIRFDDPLTLYKGMVYSYEVRTGSYPQIIHNQTLTNDYGTINCTSFVDANERSHDNWIPAIRLEGYFVDGDGVHNQNTGEHFATIQAAIDDNETQDGHTIVVYAGTYRENVAVTKRLTLRGVGMPTVDANGSGSAITVSVDGCVVDGFNVTGAGSGSEFDFIAGIRVTSDDNTLSNNTATNNSCGIWLSMSSNNTLINNIVHSNNWGIWLVEGSSYNTLTNNIVSNNSAGIQVWFSGSNLITNNTVSSNSGYGIIFGLGSKNQIYHNNFVDNTNQAGEDRQGGLYPSNSWDSGPVEGGNYWSDHVCIGNPSDGSQPYNVSRVSQDRYPFEDPWGWIKNES